MNSDFFNPDTRNQFIGGYSVPAVPFQVFISDLEYARKHNLPFKHTLTVTSIRYSIKKEQVRFNIREAIFDFPWMPESITVLQVCFTN